MCCTLSGAGMDLLRKFTEEHENFGGRDGAVPAFDALIVDEATQATEPELLIALRHAPPVVILVGDEMQLPPTVVSNAARRAGLGISAFERLVRAGIEKYQLTHQYRMHPAISHFPSRHFYASALVDRVSPHDRLAPPGFAWPDEANPVAVLAVRSGREEGGGGRVKKRARDGEPWRAGGHSIVNVAEAEAVVKVVGEMLSASHRSAARNCVGAAGIGVITFYKAQAELIRRKLDASRISECAKVECSTVDGFQGREKEVIVLSCVRAQSGDGRPELGFLRDGRRLNVALTRARRGLIIACHPPTLLRRPGAAPRHDSDYGGAPDGTRCLADLMRAAEADSRVVELDA